MIARLVGQIVEVAVESVVLDVGGVGYAVSCSRRTLGRLPPVGGTATLHIEMRLRDELPHLYGFADRRERESFRLLTTVQGVGARVALAVLSALSPDELVDAILAGDKAQLSRADGVGPRLAARIAAELRERASLLGGGGVPPAAGGGEAAATASASADTISALVNLGYGRAEAFAAVSRASRGLAADAAVEALIPAALKELAK
ncbi:MAG: Holliday junction branch migration protein RuvA [Alphaproteobacteria bacterium]|nr:Holliday junction branch migration protein RuvA [Alphaproteobacteria bacterium]